LEVQDEAVMIVLVNLVLLASMSQNSDLPPVGAVAERFCQLELSGTALDGRKSQPLLDLTIGEEEPFMADREVASECSIIKIAQETASSARATVQYTVIGKIVENADGTKKLILKKRSEKIPFELALIGGQWKIVRKSLMYVPLHATAKAWADNFADLLENDQSRKTAIDRNLEEVIAELRKL